MQVQAGDGGNGGFSSTQGGQEKPKSTVFEEKPEGEDASIMKLPGEQQVQSRALVFREEQGGHCKVE